MIASAGCSSEGKEVKTSDSIYTQDVSDMVLKVNDMPEGWSTNEPPVINNNTAESNFHKLNGMTADTVECAVVKFSSIDDAKSQYQSMYEKSSSTTSVGHPSVGDEAYGDNKQIGMTSLDTTTFRRGNVIVGIRCVGADSIDFAKIVDDKIMNRK